VPIRVLVTDEIDADGVALLTSSPALTVDESPTLSADALLEKIGDYDALVGRSATRITPELLRAGSRLRVIGRAGVGIDNIALDVATQLGVAVINAPAGNTVAVAELFFGSLLDLLRHVGQADEGMHAGRWDRSRFLGRELKGRQLGIVGLGRIGTEVARRALAFEMEVAAFDPYVADARFQGLRVRRAGSLGELLADSEVLTVHVPLTDETRAMIGRRELARLRTAAIVVNLARGGIVDEDALLDALRDGRLGGAVLDVFTHEPLPADHPLRSLRNVVLTPHIGASTLEAQRNVSVEVCAAVRDALLSGELSRSLNIASVDGVTWSELAGPLQVAERGAAVARALLATQGDLAVRRVALRIGARQAGASGALLSAAAAGVLSGVVANERLNLINARALAEARGIELAVTTAAAASNNDWSVEVAVGGGMHEVTVSGASPPGSPPRLTRIGAFHVDVQPRGTLLILTNRDVPGVIGRVGTLLGDAGMNIAEYHQARLAQGGDALAAVSVDGEVSEEVRDRLVAHPDIRSATVVKLGPSPVRS
jgi:D-3-phosphoglycerate dehydrogenase / 2-oxoglutarate reductase